jgi:hypothetical protein
MPWFSLCYAMLNTYDRMQKKTGESINSKLTLVMKSGKYDLGYKSTLKVIRQGKGTSKAFLSVPRRAVQSF